MEAQRRRMLEQKASFFFFALPYRLFLFFKNKKQNVLDQVRLGGRSGSRPQNTKKTQTKSKMCFLFFEKKCKCAC